MRVCYGLTYKIKGTHLSVVFIEGGCKHLVNRWQKIQVIIGRKCLDIIKAAIAFDQLRSISVVLYIRPTERL